MTDEENKSKITMNETAICPHCGKNILVQKIRRTIQPGQQAKYEETVKLEKDVQKKLE